MGNYEEFDIKRIVEIIFSKKLLIILILIMLLSVSLGYFYSYYYKQPVYSSSVTILLVGDENKTQKELTQTDLNINTGLISTYSSIAKSASIMQKTIDNLGLDMTASKLQKNVEAAQVDKTQFLKLTVKNSDPETAKNIANELAKVFTEQIKEIYNLQNISIVDEAEVSNIPSNENHAKDIAISAFIGVILSAILVMIVYVFDDTVKEEKDIENVLKVKSIGTLPLDKENNELIIQDNPKSHIVESIKTIRTNILYSTSKQTILITSSRPKEGKSWVTNNLAVAFAQANKRVILVDADLRKQNDRNEIFGVEKGEGLSDFIKEMSEEEIENLDIASNYIKETKISNLHLLQNGTLPPNPSELLSKNNMRRLLELLKDMYDVVILDGTACLEVSDSIALSTMVDSTLLVAESSKTKINDLKKTKKLIEDVNGKLLGVITNKAELQKGKYYGKKYGYYYGHEAGEIGKIEENEVNMSLNEIISRARETIKNKPLKIEETFEEEIINSNSNELNHEIYKEYNRKIDFSLSNFKDVILKEIRKVTNKNRDEEILQKDEEILQKIDSLEYKKEFEQISKLLLENKHQYESIINEIKNELNAQLGEIKQEINVIRKVQNENNYEVKLNQINEKINNINYEKQIAEINNKINDINYDEKLDEINNKINNINYDEKLDEINDRIEKINDERKLIEEAEKIQDNDSKVKNNIISFELLRRKKTAKKVFNIHDDVIDFEDLQRLATEVVDLDNGSMAEKIQLK